MRRAATAIGSTFYGLAYLTVFGAGLVFRRASKPAQDLTIGCVALLLLFAGLHVVTDWPSR